MMERIDWNSPASVLEKIVAYEAVHEISGLEDLRIRLAEDRRCFAFFHPAMPGDPIIFVQVALTDDLASAVGPLLEQERAVGRAEEANTAVFYSISNCHDGLRGISFGNFLIKQVVEELRRDLENIKDFVTLSPIPEFRSWLSTVTAESLPEERRDDLNVVREALGASETPDRDPVSADAQTSLMRLCAHYLVNEQHAGKPIDSVARFHLGNGATLERINWQADTSTIGLKRSFGFMVNYAYRLEDIERNHEQYFAQGMVVASAAVRKLAH